jgi:hypothetical protein
MSPADLLDKASILQIKMQRLGADLSAELQKCVALTKHIPNAQKYMEELRRLNEIGWDSNDVMFKELEAPYPNTLGDALRLIAYAKISHAVNQARITLKNEINRTLGCNEQEVKSWQVGANDGSDIRTGKVAPDA